MSRGVNKVILIGNCTADPECKFLPSGGAVTNVSVATSETWKDKNTGQKQERAEFHRVVFFNKVAEIAGEYLKKGSNVYLEGSLRTRKWKAQDGTDRYTTEIVCENMQMLDSKPEGNQQSNQSHPQNNAARQQPQQAPQQPAGFDDIEDMDIPFS